MAQARVRLLLYYEPVEALLEFHVLVENGLVVVRVGLMVPRVSDVVVGHVVHHVVPWNDSGGDGGICEIQVRVTAA